MAALVALNIVTLKDTHNVLAGPSDRTPVLCTDTIYRSCGANVMWSLRAYLKHVATCQSMDLHDLVSLPEQPCFDHAYIFRRIHEMIGTLAAGSHPFLHGKVRACTAWHNEVRLHQVPDSI